MAFTKLSQLSQRSIDRVGVSNPRLHDTSKHCIASHVSKRPRLEKQHQQARCFVSVCAATKSPTRAAPKTKKVVKEESLGKQKFRFQTQDRAQVLATVERQNEAYSVTISLPASHPSDSIQWGTFRSSAEKWFCPDSIVTGDSTPVKDGQGMSSPFTEGQAGQKEAIFRIPPNLAPVFLAFKLVAPGSEPEGPLGRSAHFAIPVGLQRGNPQKFGASLASLSADGKSCSISFAVVSRHATAMSLCLARRQADGSSKGYMEIALDPLVNRTGDVWHACVASLRDVGTLCYGWRADADISWDAGNRFHPGQVMLDPYAPVAVKVQLPDGINVPPPSKGLAPIDPQTNPPALMGCLSSLVDAFDWEGASAPGTLLSKTLVVEVDVPSFLGNPSVPESNRGKYLGVLDRVADIKSMGATAVMLTPVTLGGQGLGPFGRAPFSFFAPEPDFASGAHPSAAAEELKQVVRGLHKQGIEVYLQVEYCLTGEGWDEDASAISLRGLDAAVYYRSKGVLNCGHASVRSLILASLRHWASHYHVDGFCFVNAETLTLDRDGNVLDHPPLVEEIAKDPLLRSLKLIAWSADDSLLPRGGVRGFPHAGTWLERNKRFTQDFGSFFTGRGPPKIGSAVATRMCGSVDLFGRHEEVGFPGGLAAGRTASAGFNSASFLDGATLQATVAGILPPEAPFGQDYVLKKSLLFASIISQGTPIVGADVLEEPSLADFVARLMELRRELSKSLQPPSFEPAQDLRWYGAHPGVSPDWDGGLANAGVPAAAFLACSIHQEDGSGVYIAYNPYEGPVPAILPDPPIGSQWRRAVDTGDSSGSALLQPDWIPLSASDYTVSAKGALLLVAVPLPPARPSPTLAAGQKSRKPGTTAKARLGSRTAV